MAHQTLPVVTGDKDRSLQEVLTRLTASRGAARARGRSDRHRGAPPAGGAGVVCAVSRGHRRPAARRARGARDRAALHAPGRGVRARARAAATSSSSRRRPRARRSATTRRSSTRSCRIRRRARCICFRPRRSRRTSSPSCTRSSEHRHARHGRRDRRLHLRRRHAAGRAARDPRHARTSCSATPTCCTRASCRTIRAGRSCSRTCASSSSTSCTPIAACSAATSRTSCAGCSASAATTARTRSSSARRRRSPTRASSPKRLTERPFELVDEERRAARREVLPVRQPAGRQRSSSASAARISPKRAASRSSSCKRNLQLIVFAQSRLADRDPDDLPEGRLRRPAGRGGRDPRLSRRLPAEAPPRDRARAARGQRARGRLDQRARARHRHRRARRRGDGRLSGHDCRDLAARRPRRPAHGAIGGGAGGEQRADRSVRRPQPVVFLRRARRSTR